MPTASQCQIINTIVKKETRRPYTPYVLDEDYQDQDGGDENPSHGATPLPIYDSPQTAPQYAYGGQQAYGTRQGNIHGSPISSPQLSRSGGTGEYLRSSMTPTSPGLRHRRLITTTSWRERDGVSSRQNQVDVDTGSAESPYDRHSRSSFRNRGSMFQTRGRSASGKERHPEMTLFQKQCMESVERSLSPRRAEAHSAGTYRQTEVGRTTDLFYRSSGNTEFPLNNPLDPSLIDSRQVWTAPMSTDGQKDAGSRINSAQKPRVRFDNTIEVLGSMGKDNDKLLAEKQLEQKVKELLTGGASFLPSVPDVKVMSDDQMTDPDVKINDDEVGDKNAEENDEEKKDEISKALFPVKMAGLYLKLPFEVTDEMRDRLWELGWRKPGKPKKKIIKEETTTNNPSVDLSDVKALMDLKKDPMLRKARKARAVPIQTKPPEPNPSAVCFNMLGSSLTHKDVWIAFKKDVLTQHPEVRIASIQFVPRAIFVKRPKGGDPIEDRWVITLTSEWFRNRVSGMDLNFKGGAVQLRRYDDVVNCEYRQYTRMTDYMKMVSMKK